MRRVLGALAQIIAAIIVSFLLGQVAARLVPTTDRLFFSICTVGVYILGVVIGVYFTAEILDISGNFWFLLSGAVLSGILVFAAYSFERFIIPPVSPTDPGRYRNSNRPSGHLRCLPADRSS